MPVPAIQAVNTAKGALVALGLTGNRQANFGEAALAKLGNVLENLRELRNPPLTLDTENQGAVDLAVNDLRQTILREIQRRTISDGNPQGEFTAEEAAQHRQAVEWLFEQHRLATQLMTSQQTLIREVYQATHDPDHELHDYVHQQQGQHGEPLDENARREAALIRIQATVAGTYAAALENDPEDQAYCLAVRQAQHHGEVTVPAIRGRMEMIEQLEGGQLRGLMAQFQHIGQPILDVDNIRGEDPNHEHLRIQARVMGELSADDVIATMRGRQQGAAALEGQLDRDEEQGLRRNGTVVGGVVRRGARRKHNDKNGSDGPSSF